MKQTLERTFDIPFVYETGVDSYPWVKIAPRGERGKMFSVKITNRSEVRLIIDFEPQSFSAAIIDSMGKAGEDKRMLFCDNVRLQKSRGGEVSMKINGSAVDPSDSSSWPSDAWRRVESRTVVVLPADVSGCSDAVADSMREWGCLVMGTFLSLVRIDPIGADCFSSVPEREGDRYSVVASRYERSALNRYLCLKKFGYKCRVCGIDFRQKYGHIGEHFIHVHHVVPVSRMGAGYLVDPETDLIPVCPNCHAMLHRKDPPFSPAEVAKMIADCRDDEHEINYGTFKPSYRQAADREDSQYVLAESKEGKNV